MLGWWGGRETVAAQFTWGKCGRDTLSAYEQALA